jgi:hypothetical protein
MHEQVGIDLTVAATTQHFKRAIHFNGLSAMMLDNVTLNSLLL